MFNLTDLKGWISQWLSGKFIKICQSKINEYCRKTSNWASGRTQYLMFNSFLITFKVPIEQWVRRLTSDRVRTIFLFTKNARCLTKPRGRQWETSTVKIFSRKISIERVIANALNMTLEEEEELLLIKPHQNIL